MQEVLGKRSRPEGSQSSRKAAKKARAAAVDGLAWKSVAIPDRMDDAEGFFGLEEVEDVEVVKDASGKVTFVKAGQPVNLYANGDDDAGNGSVADDGEEWTGFDDDVPNAEVEKSGSAKKEKAKKKKEKNAKEKKSKDRKLPANGEKPAKTGFDLLDDGSEEDGGVSVDAWLPLKLSPDTMASLAKLKFAQPTAIQESTIPEILAGHDVIGKASTGSGKTLAFGIPILERFLQLPAAKKTSKQNKEIEEAKSPIALVLSPTRDLAHQISKHLSALCSNGLFDGPVIATLTGGLSLLKQQRILAKADIVVGTPGRVWEVISSGHGTIDSLKKIQFLVIDEADRLLSEGHFKEMEEILQALEWQKADDDDKEYEGKKQTSAAIERQTLIFSATFDRGLQAKLGGKAKYGGDLMNNKESLAYLLSKVNFREETPKFIDVNPVNQLANRLKEGLITCAGTEKDLYLYSLLLLHPNSRTLVFANSISAVRRLTPFLQNLNLPAVALHSGMIQKARLRSIERYTDSKSTQSSILIATDVAARGLDIPNIDLVIHYHLPRAADTYVHRSGRTARAGQSGSSILICGPEEVAGVRRLVAKVHAQSAVSSDQSAADAAKAGYYIRTLDIDRRIVARLKPRAQLAKELADTTQAKEKNNKDDDFFRTAAEDLGVEYDSEELDQQGPGKRGRGAGRKQKERQNRERTKGEVAAMKAQLRDLLKQRVNVGVSEKYLTAGGIDMDELLRQREAVSGTANEFLGNVSMMTML